MAQYTHTCTNCMTAFDSPDSKLSPFITSLVSRDILDTNDPPIESQIPFLRDFVSMGRARMTALDAKIASLQSSLDKLREERDGLDMEVQKHEGGLSPLRRMPTEILSLIFTFTLPPYQPGAEPAPWTVSAVCARWRLIVISQPYFWTTIRYHSEKVTSMVWEAFRLETQLRRSRELALDVEFFTADPSFCTPDDLHIVQIFCKHARRWERVSISGSERLYLEVETHIQDQLALLRELTIEMDQDNIPTMDMFNDAPLLQRVIANKFLWICPLPLALPWSQLLYYGGSNTWDGHLLALHTATNLVDCSLEIREISDLSSPQSPILLPRLLRLSLSHTEFLECLETPALLELYCDYADPVLPFLRRLSSKLQKLTMWEGTMPADDTNLTHMVEAVPAITTLVLRFPVPAAFIHDFCSRPNFAPALERLVNVLPTGDDVQNHFVQGIESRWANGRLKSVKVYSSSAFAPNLLYRLELLRAQGMEFMVYLDTDRLLLDAIPLELQIQSEG